MERTTIYLDDSIRRQLLELSAEESRKTGKHAGMAKIIRTAIVQYLEKHGKTVTKSKSYTERKSKNDR